VIEEEDLKKGIRIIGECLRDLDELETIPGETAEEKGHVDELAC
jgi:ornithine--oxo-acid transaminase